MAYSINTDALDALYKRLKPKGVTMSGLLAKAAGVALSKFPTLYAGELQILMHPASHSLLLAFFSKSIWVSNSATAGMCPVSQPSLSLMYLMHMSNKTADADSEPYARFCAESCRCASACCLLTVLPHCNML